MSAGHETGRAPRDGRGGFTLVEVTLVLALMVPVLLVIGSATRAVVGSFTATDRAARTTEIVLRALAEFERAMRAGQRHELQTVAVRDDVRQGRAAAVGEWFVMPNNEARTRIQVLSLVGEDGLELAVPTRLHRFEFVSDPDDRVDGRDNDGDGMIDEGSLMFTRGTDTLMVVDDLETCTFELQGQAVHLTLKFVRPGHGGALERSTLRHTVVMHNP